MLSGNGKQTSIIITFTWSALYNSKSQLVVQQTHRDIQKKKIESFLMFIPTGYRCK